MTVAISPQDVPPGLISLKTAAGLIAVDPKTILNWIKAGDLQGWQLNGRMWRVQKDQVLALAKLVMPGGAA